MKIPILSDRTDVVHVEFRHVFQLKDKANGHKMKPYTEATVWWMNGGGKRAGGTGIAFVHPNDTPEKRIGRKIALTRALWASGLPKKERRQVWMGLLDRGMRV